MPSESAIAGLLALRGHPPAVEAATAEAVAHELYGLTARATALDGERDRNFRLAAADGRQLVLKFIDHEADDVVVEGQSAALAHIAEQNAPLAVPRVVPTLGGESVGVVSLAGGGGDDTTGVLCRVRLVSYLPGRLLQDTVDPTPGPRGSLLRSVGNHIAQLDQALAGFFHPALAQPIAWDVRRAPALLPVLEGIQSAQVRRVLGTALEPLEQLLLRMRGLRSQAIHGDCHGRNLLVNDAGDACVGIIDLGDMIHAPLALEIAVTMAELLTDGVASLDELPELLAGYTSLQPLERADVEVLYDLIAVRIAVGVLIQEWRDRNGGRPDAANARGETHGPARGEAHESARGEAHESARGEAHESARGEAHESARGETHGLARGEAHESVQGGTHGPARGETTHHDLATASATALEALAARGKERLTQQWLEAAGVVSVKVGRGRVLPADLVQRRHNALGASAELSYDQPLHLVRGEGVWVYTSDAERYLDVYNNVPHVGHAHPAVVAAIANQAKRIASNTRYLDTHIIEYVERLTETLPPDLNACLFVNSGSEANDIAWRIAKAHTGHEGALVMKFAYHGITDAITALSPAICPNVPPHVEQLAAPANGIAPPNMRAAGMAPGADLHSRLGSNPGGSSANSLGLATTPGGSSANSLGLATTPGGASANSRGPDTNRAAGGPEDVGAADIFSAAAEADVAAAIERLERRGFKPAALMIDSALTSTGIYDPPPAWIAPIAAAVRKAGGLIIGDEVQFGLGRSGSHFWGFTRRGYHPDIVTLGKPVGNGYPLGVVITRRALLEKFQRDTGFFSTFGGNPVAAAAGLAVLDVLDKERLVENARVTGEYFIRRLKDLAQTHSAIRDVRGCGLMVGAELTDRETTKRVVNGLRERGVLTGSEGPLGNVLKLRPPMPFHMEHVEIVIDALNETLFNRYDGRP